MKQKQTMMFFAVFILLILFISPALAPPPSTGGTGAPTKEFQNQATKSAESPGDGSRIRTSNPTAISPSKGIIRSANLPANSFVWSDSQGFHASAVDNMRTRKGVEMTNAKNVLVGWNDNVKIGSAAHVHVPGADIKNAENVYYDAAKRELNFSKAEQATAMFPRSDIPHIRDGM